MRSFQKRALALLLSVVLCLSLMPTVLAAEGESDTTTNDKLGQLTYTQILAPQYEDAKQFNEGLAAVKRNGKWGYIDEEGNVKINFLYDEAYSFSEGVAVVATRHTVRAEDSSTFDVYAYGVVTTTGAFTPFYYTNLYDSPDYGEYYYGHQVGTSSQGLPRLVYAAEENDTYLREVDPTYPLTCVNGYVYLLSSLVNASTGMVVVDEYGDPIIAYSQLTEGMFAGTYLGDGSMYYFDANGNELLDLTAGDYWDAHPFNQGLAIVENAVFNEDNFWEYSEFSIINTQGQVVLPRICESYYIQGYNTRYQIFDEAGRLAAARKDLWGAVTKTGQIAIPFRYESLMPSTEGRITFEENGLWGMMDSNTLEVVIPAQYTQLSSLHQGLAVGEIDGHGVVMDRYGNTVPGSEDIAVSAYFKVLDNGSTSITSVDEYVVIEVNGRYGFGKIEYLPALPLQSEMSDWAYAAVCSAIELELVPADLQNLYRNNITRGDFASTIVQSMEVISGQDREALLQSIAGKTLAQVVAERPYYDSNDEDVLVASALGIVSGYGNGQVRPYNSITREEAAAMLTRAARALGSTATAGQSTTFADNATIQSWARESVAFVASIGVMNGTGNNRFSPTQTYTREQTFTTVYRLLLALNQQ